MMFSLLGELSWMWLKDLYILRINWPKQTKRVTGISATWCYSLFWWNSLRSKQKGATYWGIPCWWLAAPLWRSWELKLLIPSCPVVLLWVCCWHGFLTRGALLQCREVSGHKLPMVYSVSLHWLWVMQGYLFYFLAGRWTQFCKLSVLVPLSFYQESKLKPSFLAALD